MTITQVADSVYNLSVAGYFNGEKFTRSQFRTYCKSIFGKWQLKLGNKAVIQIALPDGWWYMYLIRFNDRKDGFSYEIPENREDEADILRRLLA